MQLADLVQLVEGADLLHPGGVEILGVAHDSRSVKPSDLFVCLVSEKFDGHRFASDAVARGAIALAVQNGSFTDLPSVPALSVPSTRAALPKLACAVYGYPSRRIILVGVTGTNGKTTSTFLVSSILQAAGMK